MAYYTHILQMQVWRQLGKRFQNHGANVELDEKLGLFTSKMVSVCATAGERMSS